VSAPDNYETLSAAQPTPANQLPGLNYDIAGNPIGTGQYAYDAENRISTTASGYTYTYDGDGQRVEKSSQGTGTLYWTGNNGEVLAESDLSGNFTEYIYFNGQRVARRDSSGNPHYYFSDHLGSHDVVANAAGACEQDIDFYPYGGQVNDYCPTQVPQHYKFTGKERDSETNLDFFGERYYGSNLGRFMQPDPVLNSGHPADPQTWNRYAYVSNNPLRFIDPLGLFQWSANCEELEGSICKQQRDTFRAAYEGLKKAAQGYAEGSDERKQLDAIIAKIGDEGKGDTSVGFNSKMSDLGVASGNKMTFNFSKLESLLSKWDAGTISTAEAALVGHEGEHLVEGGGFTKDLGYLFSGSSRVRQETGPFTVESLVFKTFNKLELFGYSLGMSKGNPNGWPLWNPSWGAVDADRLRKLNVQRNVEELYNHKKDQNK
jgi:RHS repeat-associated protein